MRDGRERMGMVGGRVVRGYGGGGVERGGGACVGWDVVGRVGGWRWDRGVG